MSVEWSEEIGLYHISFWYIFPVHVDKHRHYAKEEMAFSLWLTQEDFDVFNAAMTVARLSRHDTLMPEGE